MNLDVEAAEYCLKIAFKAIPLSFWRIFGILIQGHRFDLLFTFTNLGDNDFPGGTAYVDFQCAVGHINFRHDAVLDIPNIEVGETEELEKRSMKAVCPRDGQILCEIRSADARQVQLSGPDGLPKPNQALFFFNIMPYDQFVLIGVTLALVMLTAVLAYFTFILATKAS